LQDGTSTFTQRAYLRGVSYNLTLPCGCLVYVSCQPQTGVAHTRVIETRALKCEVRRHAVGARLCLWELLPDLAHRARPVFVSDGERLSVA
jgi:hypothetical protein